MSISHEPRTSELTQEMTCNDASIGSALAFDQCVLPAQINFFLSSNLRFLDREPRQKLYWQDKYDTLVVLSYKTHTLANDIFVK